MPTLEELLRASLKGANEKFDQADKALHAAVAETAKAVEAVTEGKARLRLVQQKRSADYTRYDLVIAPPSGGEKRKLATLDVSSAGFPIERLDEYTYDDGRMTLDVMEKFDSADKLSVYFKKLVADQDSPLVAYLAYLVRARTDPSTGNDDSIPF